MNQFHLQMAVEHAILFLSDPTVDETVPDDTSAAIVTATRDCICFWVQPDVDGPASVMVSDGPCEREGVECFVGTIRTPGRVVALSTSRGFAFLNIPVPDMETIVQIWASGLEQPEWTWIKLPIAN